MNSLIGVNPKELMSQHQAALRAYAKRVMVQGDGLTPAEDDDRARRMQEYMAIGRSLNVTHKEMVAVIFRGMFAVKRGCGCPTCRERATSPT